MQILNDFLQLLLDNFWYLLIIILLYIKSPRGGIALLLSHIILGFQMWSYLTIIIITLTFSPFYNTFNDISRNKPKRKDPDYK